MRSLNDVKAAFVKKYNKKGGEKASINFTPNYGVAESQKGYL